jgi:AcrR family transcriptional regulator
MRITAAEKAATRQRILDAAKRLFRLKGFEQATTREIAREVGVATGTMFNYFPSKEAVVVELAVAALEKADRDFANNRRSRVSLEEDLFAHVAAQLRQLRAVRPYIKPLLDTALSPAAAPRADDRAALLRADLTEQFAGILADHGVDEPSAVAMNIFWALYVGVLTFWGSDKSPKQEDTLALLDQSTQMFASWLG